VKCRKYKYDLKIGIIAVLFLMNLILTGCWNNKDLSEINMVTAIGIDRTEDGKVVLTVQVVEPAAIQSSGSRKGGGGGAQLKPIFVQSYEGETVFDALRSMLSVVDKKMFLSTAQVLILGERLSRNGINEALDFFQRDHEVGYTMDVLVARYATPKEILEMETDIDSIPAMYIKGTIENTVSRAKVKQTMLIDLIKDMGNSGREIAIGQVTKAGEKRVRTEGTAVFRDGKLVGWLDPYETRGYLFATGKVESTVVNVPADEGTISMEVIRSKGKVNVEFENGEPAILTIRVRVEANVGEYRHGWKLDSPDDLHKLEEILAEEVNKEIRMALDRTQKDYSSDIFGFGTQLYKYHLKYWKEVKDGWNDIFSRLPFDIKVDAKIKRTGVTKGAMKKDG